MNRHEKSAIIGYYRMGATYKDIGYIMGISEAYAKQIISEYLKEINPLNLNQLLWQRRKKQQKRNPPQKRRERRKQ